MKLLIIGATGPLGQLVVKEAIGQGHEVTALVRNPDKLTTKDDKLKVVKGNIFDEAEIKEHLTGCDAILSAVGGQPGLFTPCDVYSQSGAAVLKAMRATGVKKYISVTSWGTKDDPGLPFIWRWVIKPTFLRNVVNDMVVFEDFLEKEAGDIDYIVVRPPKLLNTPSAGVKLAVQEGQYVQGDVLSKVSREDVARFMLECLKTDEYNKKMIAITTPKTA